MNNKRKYQNEIQETLAKYKNIKNINKDEIIQYYGVLREMLKSFNQLILDATIRGTTLILAVIAVTGYLPSKDNLVTSLGSLFLIIVATVLCFICSFNCSARFLATFLKASPISFG